MKLYLLGKVRGKKFLTQIWVFGSFFRPLPPPRGGGCQKNFLLVPSFQNYVLVVCRNTKGTCLKSVSKTPTFRFSGIPALKETVAHIQPNSQFWKVFGQNGQDGIFFQKSVWNIFFAVKNPI